jgi:omega-amidase
MRVTLVQFAPVWEDRAASRARIADLLAGVRSDWIVLPEMALSGFTMSREASTWDRADFDFFSSLARGRGCHVTVGAVVEGCNTALAFSPDGSIAAAYRKRHLFSFSGEERHYQAGTARCSYAVCGFRVAQAICYDLRFPNHFWPDADGTDAYCVIAAWGGKRAEHWKILLRARAIENQAWVIGVNRVGSEPSGQAARVEYSGDSAVIDPQGRTLLDCGLAEGAFTAELDPKAAPEWRRAFPALLDRRSDGACASDRTLPETPAADTMKSDPHPT